ncbi:hypothetical protein [Pseudoalteromonas luteoviolacea]|uniref:hypothetical protein n=1 Tax=Pseudoalteromonas luteoviolacea TaxID=43657 RepID=UPI0012D44BBE|nr:hypothetical protein [Pseudoalteromonas luteoviolacea]
MALSTADTSSKEAKSNTYQAPENKHSANNTQSHVSAGHNFGIKVGEALFHD